MLPTLSNFLLVSECLLDARRVRIFKDAIERTVKPGDIVVDAGTGTGIMALCAARAGAKKVFAIELDSDIAKVARYNAKINGYENIIEVLNQDVATFSIKNSKRPADVLIIEMLDTGLIAEHQVIAIIGLKQNGVIDIHTRILPEKVNLLIQAIDYDYDFYGFHMPSIIQARNYGVRKKIKATCSSLQSYGIIKFMALTSRRFDAKVNLKINQSGVINAVELKTHIYLRGRKYFGTSDMNIPVIIPMKERKVKQGDLINLGISYRMGDSFGSLKIV